MIPKKLNNKLVLLFLVGVLLSHFLFRVYNYREQYLQPFDAAYWEERYLASQWVVPDSKQSIGDDGLYTYAGWEYITGRDPTTLNAEAPPLGKYVIGFVTMLFGNQNVFGILTGILALVCYYFLNSVLFKNKIVAFIPVVIFSFEPLFYEQYRSTFLDLFQLSFLFLIFAFFLRKNYLLSSIFLGAFMAVRFSSFALLVVIACMSYLLLVHRNDIPKYILHLFAAPVIYIMSYLRFFLLGNSFFDFLGIQKWIIMFYAGGVRAQFGAVFPLLFTGYWFTWFDGLHRIREWSILWPISALLAGFSLPSIAFGRKHEILLIALWSLCYFVFLCIVPIAPRYLLLLLPFLYNLAVWVLSKNTHVRSFLALS